MNASTASISRQDIQAALAQQAKTLAKASRKIQAQTRGRGKWIAVAALALIATAAAVHHFKPTAQAMALTEEPSHLRVVSLVAPAVNTGAHELLLPAEVRAFQSTAINARIAGYLKAWHADRGTRVKAGQMLAEIDAPEFDQELIRAQSELEEGRTNLSQTQAERDQALANLNAARANILKAEATRDLAAKTELRFKDLEEKWAATRQQYDEAVRNHDVAKAEVTAVKANAVSSEAAVATKEAGIRTAQARINSLEASLKRLKELEIFKTIVAPYDGVITQRNADVGALVSTDGSRTLFTIVQDETLRVAVNVPQTYAGVVKVGQDADILAREFSAQGLKARVARTSGSIDASARTLAVELELNNTSHQVFPGAFVQVKFNVQDEQPTLVIPVKTLRFSKEGTQVFSVSVQNRLELHTVKLGRDFGTNVEVLSGLSGKPELVVNPSDSMANGEEVRVETAGQTKVASN